jgi:hypothetical protein
MNKEQLIALNMAINQVYEKNNATRFDKLMIYVIYIAVLAAPLFVLRVVVESLLINYRGGF